MSFDASLCTRFASEWLANPQWWFQCSPSIDAYLTETFGSLLALREQLPVSIGRVLVLDQLPHHIHRHEHKQANTSVIEEFRNPHNDEAVIVSRSLREQVEGGAQELSAQEMTFALLPLRHSRCPELVIEAIKIAWSQLRLCEDRVSTDHLIWTRFLTATYKQAHTCDWSTYLDIHEIGQQAPQAQQQPVDVKSFEDILVVHEPAGVGGAKDESSHDIDATFAAWFNEHAQVLKEDASCLIISLSGGVDSNISSFILANYWRKEHKLSHLPLVAVHINYKNKPLCDRDEEMVVAWCKYIGIPCYVRRISEIQRKPCMDHGMRSIYESYTENVRFDAYRNAAKLVASEAATAQGRKPIVFFGHNQCDTFENIIINVIRKQHMDNLRGMVPLLPMHDVFCARPMLTVPKDDIRAYARRYQIPHLQDSTPAWSQRGKIRSIIRKAFDEYDPNLTPGMFHLADRMAESSLMLKSFVSMALRYAEPLDKPPSPFVAAWTLKLSTSDLRAPFAPAFWCELLLQLTQLRCNQGSLNNSVERCRTFLKQSQQLSVNLQFHLRIQVELNQPSSVEHIVCVKLLPAK